MWLLLCLCPCDVAMAAVFMLLWLYTDIVIHDLEVCANFVVLYCTRDTRPVAAVIDPVREHEPYLIVRRRMVWYSGTYWRVEGGEWLLRETAEQWVGLVVK